MKFWIPTALVAFALVAGGFADLTGGLDEPMTHLGYPAYFTRIIGVWKILGAVAILAPGFKRLKEWAYAGIFFDLSGAAISHLAVGDSLGEAAAPIVLTGLALASWALRPEDRRLPDA